MNAPPRRLRVDHAGAGGRLAGHRPGERQHHRRGRQQQQQARLPAERIHEQVRVGKGDEPADARRHAERGDGAGALVGRRGATDRTDQRVEPGAADADAEQDAADEQVVARLGRIHEIHAGHRRHRARDHDPAGAVAVGDHAGEDGAETPHQVGHRHRHGERLAADAQLLGHGRQIEPHHLAQPHGDADDEAGGEDDHPQRPGGGGRRWRDFLHGGVSPWLLSAAYSMRWAHDEREYFSGLP